MGKFVASISHLRILMNTTTKDAHGLTSTDITGADKMNFRAVLAISNERVESLLKNVPGSAGTVVYLRVIRYVLQSFTAKDISASERIYFMWYAVFVLRHWRKWILTDCNTRAANFITSNAYICIELNAHALINCVLKCRDTSGEDSFLVWLFNSQTCESFFRKARSQTSTYCTIINFSMLDFLHRAKRIQALEDISRELKNKYVIARQQQSADHRPEESLPSNDDITKIINAALTDARTAVNELGMIGDTTQLEIPPITHTNTQANVDEDTRPVFETEPADAPPNSATCADDDMRYDLYLLQKHNDFECLRQLQSVSTALNAQCLRFTNKKGEHFFVKKSTLCWLMNNTTNQKVSTDRIRRFMVESGSGPSLLADRSRGELVIGDWCEFKHNDEVVGQVISFTYLTGKRSERAYTLDSVPLRCPTGVASKGIGVMCNWFKVMPGFVLEIAEIKEHTYININEFKTHLHKPHINNDGNLVLDEKDHVVADDVQC